MFSTGRGDTAHRFLQSLGPRRLKRPKPTYTEIMKTLAASIFSWLLLFTGYPVNAEISTTQDQFYSERAKGDREIEPTKYEFTLKGSRFELTNRGSGVRYTDGVKVPFELPLEKGSLLETVRYFAVENDLVVLFSEFDGEGSKSAIVRFDNRTMAPRWATAVYGFNVGDALVTGKYAYLTTFGFVGKLDLESGKFVWRHEGLYKRNPYAFNSFDRPFIVNATVNFPERLDIIHKRRKLTGFTIVIDDVTGKILDTRSK